MLVQQHYMPMPTTVGSVAVPLGQTRLQIARLIAMMIMTGQDCVIVELANIGTLSVLLVTILCFAVYSSPVVFKTVCTTDKLQSQ